MSIYAPREAAGAIGARARALRLAQNRRQADLATAAGVTLATLRRFEATGRVGFEAVIRVALALGAEREFALLFPAPEARSLDDILDGQHRRARASR
jgi:transcriptional regulator with XRE-family HTH domain